MALELLWDTYAFDRIASDFPRPFCRVRARCGRNSPTRDQPESCFCDTDSIAGYPGVCSEVFHGVRIGHFMA
jgi:hypothetical protein